MGSPFLLRTVQDALKDWWGVNSGPLLAVFWPDSCMLDKIWETDAGAVVWCIFAINSPFSPDSW